MQIYKTLPELTKPRHRALWYKSFARKHDPRAIDWKKPGLTKEAHRDALARILSPVLMGEQAGLYSITRIIQALGKDSDFESQLFLTTMAVDEARHTELFVYYYGRLEREPMPIRRLPSGYLFQSEIMSDEPMVWLTGSLVSECLAKMTLEEIIRLDVDPVFTEMATDILEDETRHLGFNHVYLEDRFRNLYTDERAEAGHAVERLMERLESVLDKVPPILEALGSDIRGMGIDPGEFFERLQADCRKRLTRSIESGERKALVAPV